MGFRSTFTTIDHNVTWPDWFADKYKGSVFFPPNNTGALSARHECKLYLTWADLIPDIQLVIAGMEDNDDFNFVVVFLHECGGIDRCQISKDSVKWSTPTDWGRRHYASHHYCYGCSGAPDHES